MMETVTEDKMISVIFHTVLILLTVTEDEEEDDDDGGDNVVKLSSL